MPAIDVDRSRLPLLLVTLHGEATDAEFDGYLAALSTNLERRCPTAVILDCRRGSPGTAAQRRRQAQWIDAHRDDLRRYTKGTAFVIDNPVVRGALTAIFWLTRYETPYTVVPTLEEAMAWSEAKLREAEGAPG